MAQVQSLVRELRSHKLHSVAKNKNQPENLKKRKKKNKGKVNGSGIPTKRVHFVHLYKLSKFDANKTQKAAFTGHFSKIQDNLLS